MKIVCESCGAKYSIADEKVAGKVFKIRCKKCSAVIVVKGESPEGNDEATRVYDQSGEAIWHVVVGGEQQGPLAPRQIGELLSEATIDWEAYVWREGMDGWQPAKDVAELVSSVMADAKEAGAAQQEEARAEPAYGTGRVFGGSGDMGADPFASDDGGLGSVINQPAAARAGDDLFAKSARSPFSGVSDDEERAPASRPNARPNAAEAMTGQRNENSVLFSLSNLQALATGSGGAPPTTGGRAGMAVGEGSGLIDIRALASATQTVSEKSNGSSRDKIEDLLSVGAGTGGFSAAHFAAPVAVEKADNSKLLIGGMVAAILILGGAVGYLALREPAAPAQMVAAAGTAAPAAVAPAGQEVAQAAAAPVQEPRADRPRAAAADEEEPEDEADAPAERSTRDRDSKSSGSHSKRSAKESSSRTPEKEPAAAAPEPAPAPAKKSSGDQSIDDLLSGALGNKGGSKSAAAAAPKPAPSANLPSTPSRDDVLGALKAVSGKVSACGKGQSGIAMAKIAVAGPTGRVTNVDVSGQFAGSPVASCVAKEVSKARFPKFSQPSFSVTFPFKI